MMKFFDMFSTPAGLYVIGTTALCLLIGIFLWSIWFYNRAKSLVPYLHEIKDLCQQIELQKALISATQKKIQELDKEYKEKLVDLAKANQKVAEKENAELWLSENGPKVEGLKSEITNLQQICDDLIDKRDQRQRELSDLIQEVANKTQERDALVKEKDALDVAKSRMDVELQSLETTKKTHEEKIAKLAQEIESLSKRSNELHAQVQDFEQRRDELISMRKELKELQEEITNAKQLLQNLRAENSSISATKRGLEADVKDLENKKNQCQSQVEKLSSDISAMKDERNELHAQVQDLQRKQEEYDRLTEQSDELRREVAKLQGERDFATKQIAEWERIHQDNNDKWRNLEIPVVQTETARHRTDLDENDWLNEFSEKLKENGLKFNERSILAFHTGLKCADISPLVVLAGISGTGKSLLPELYAAAAGMNFLPVAVQPRWDSPQDLFGFYNYMEGRYKATELSRLLWQYDIFNNAKVSKQYATSLPMNIVMLDEMNLARVEYYFSDLLSKLETRHGINYDDDEMRRKAEIELDCNASMSTDGVRRLFVNGNTLFVGTMNEDESTQTLSDKVIDRSNVLRFGRPETLDARPDKSAFIELWEERPKIDHRGWTKWCRLNEANRSEMSRILDPINPILDRIQRPFAHRVHQAMEKYVQFYPGRVQDAIADQIEMKILPKLNGVELDAIGFGEVKDQLRQSIELTGDERLAEAFGIACDENRSSFFKWHGVMR